jgi:DnaJ-class molecular chaperone
VIPLAGEGMPIQGTKSRGSLFVEILLAIDPNPDEELKAVLRKRKSAPKGASQKQEL